MQEKPEVVDGLDRSYLDQDLQDSGANLNSSIQERNRTKIPTSKGLVKDAGCLRHRLLATPITIQRAQWAAILQSSKQRLSL